MTDEERETARRAGILSWDESRALELDDCKHCGSRPEIQHIGNEMGLSMGRKGKKRCIKVKCSNVRCRIERTDCSLYQGFAWLEVVAEKCWNRRPAAENP